MSQQLRSVDPVAHGIPVNSRAMIKHHQTFILPHFVIFCLDKYLDFKRLALVVAHQSLYTTKLLYSTLVLNFCLHNLKKQNSVQQCFDASIYTIMRKCLNKTRFYNCARLVRSSSCK